MKRTLFAIAIIFISTASFSQAKVEIGAKGGINLSSLSGNNVGDNVTAYHGGAYTLIKITKFGIQPEALFSKRGSDKVDLSYLDVPVMLKFYVAGGFNLQAGPQFGIILNAEDEDGQDLKSALENSDLSAAFGAGIDLPMGLNVTGRYIIGLKDVDKGTGEVKNNMFQLSVGYSLFKLGN